MDIGRLMSALEALQIANDWDRYHDPKIKLKNKAHLKTKIWALRELLKDAD